MAGSESQEKRSVGVVLDNTTHGPGYNESTTIVRSGGGAWDVRLLDLVNSDVFIVHLSKVDAAHRATRSRSTAVLARSLRAAAFRDRVRSL